MYGQKRSFIDVDSCQTRNDLGRVGILFVFEGFVNYCMVVLNIEKASLCFEDSKAILTKNFTVL